jgi:hypothetical protein
MWLTAGTRKPNASRSSARNETNETTHAYSQRRLVVAISACVLPLFAFSWFLRVYLENVNDRSWIALLTLVVLLVTTATTWFRLGHLPSIRPWLVRHVIGNVVLAVGLIAAWSFDLALFYYVAIVVGVFVMWMWGTWKLCDAVKAGGADEES